VDRLDRTRSPGRSRSPRLRRDRPQDLEDLAAGQDHVVTSSIATADDDTIGHVTTTGARQRLPLTCDGVHKPVPHASLVRAMRTFSDSAACANKVTLAPRYFGGTDDAAPIVIDLVVRGGTSRGAIRRAAR
jgi:hypothetical protein